MSFRGFPACSCLAMWLPAYERELQRRGLLEGDLRIYQLIGGAAASGGTHATGGAFDILDLPGEHDLWVARQMGADATWSRTEKQGFMPHIHGVLTGCPHNGPAAYQIDAVRAGFNGLGRGGRGAPDDGPRPLSGRTWRQGIEWARQQEDDMTPEDKAQLERIEQKLDADIAVSKRARDLVLALARQEQARDGKSNAKLDALIAAAEADE